MELLYDNVATITVGLTLQLMVEEHYIAWIFIKATRGIKRKDLRQKKPIAKFSLLEKEKVLEANDYCNLHSLWVKNNK